jgi:hypothetical protein
MSDNFPHLANAPIVEAIVDIRVRLPDGFEVARFKDLHPQFQSDYPEVEDRKLVEHKFEQSPTVRRRVRLPSGHPRPGLKHHCCRRPSA